jgi:N-acetylglucosaminyldiphosphoundecaprenol N-acetyl-beta-D-mannosaminyltransferase
MEEVGRFQVAGVPVDPVDTRDSLQRMVSAFGTAGAMQVCTVNLDFVVRAQADPEVKQILNQSDLNVPDGFPIVWLGRLQGFRLKERVAGADMVPMLMALAAENRARVFLLGGEGGSAEAAARRLKEQFPDLDVAGWHEPPRASIDDMDNEAIVRLINESRADVLLVALGNPKQEKWIGRHRARLGVSVAIGVGCCLDLMAGRISRAPRWMQACDMEWLYRLAHEPGRLASRYVKDLWCLANIAPPLVWQRVRRSHLPSPLAGAGRG